jgi:TPR repeat protein
VPKDYKQAYFWLTLGAIKGDAKAANLRDFAESRLTPPQVEEVQRSARDWKPKKDDKSWVMM